MSRLAAFVHSWMHSRIKEAGDGGLSDREAVASGVERTGRIGIGEGPPPPQGTPA